MWKALKLTAMSVGAIAVLLVVLVIVESELEIVSESYGTYDEAVAGGVFERGWIPDVLPAGSFAIVATHDLDTNERCARASVVSGAAADVAARLLSAGFTPWKEDIPPVPSLGLLSACPLDERTAAEGSVWRRMPLTSIGRDYVSISRDGRTLLFWSAIE